MGNETYNDLLVSSELSPPNFGLIGNDEFYTNLVLSPDGGNGLWTRRMLRNMALCQAVHGWVCGVILPEQDDVKRRDRRRGRRVALLLRVDVRRCARSHHQQIGEDDHDDRIVNRRRTDD